MTPTLDQLLRRRGQPLHVHVADEDVRLQANSFWIARAISNLVRNASNYSDDGMPITLTVEQIGDRLEIRIRNVGVPSSAYGTSDLFERQGPQDRDALDLAVAQKIIHLHGGSIIAERLGSGLGVVFLITLPIESSLELAAG